MDRFDSLALTSLTQIEQPGCVSLLMPTQRNGTAIPEDQLRCRNLLRAADTRLTSEGWRAPDIAAVLAPGYALLSDSAYWRQLAHGLALFLSPEAHFEYRLPLAPPEQVTVARRFQLKTLLPLWERAARFYVLALSQNTVQLYSGTAEGLTAVPAAHLPHSLAEVFAGHSFEKELRVRTGAPVGAGPTASFFYSSSGEAEAYKQELAQFCRQVSHGVQEWLAGATTPLVLAGVAYLVALYREHNHYPHVMKTAVSGNPERLTPEALHQAAWGIVAPLAEAPLAAAMARYRALAGARRATHDIRGIVRAASRGRVHTLFAAADHQVWGRFDPVTEAARLQTGPTADADDLVNVAALEAHRHGGEVYLLPQTALPAASPLAAILRY